MFPLPSRLTVAAVALLACLTAGPASADPIPVRGIIGISSHGGDFPDIEEPLLEFFFSFGPLDQSLPGLVTVSGDAHATSSLHGTTGGLQVTRAPLPQSLAAGSLYDLSTTVTWASGTMQDYMGETSVWYGTSGTFHINAGTALLQGGDQQLNGVAPYTFTALVTAFDRETGATLFERRFEGSGVARGYLYPSEPDRFLYRYEAVPAPVPEPGTLTLLAAGVCGVFARRRERRRLKR